MYSSTKRSNRKTLQGETKMEDSKTEKTARKFEGVMLALTIKDATFLRNAITGISPTDPVKLELQNNRVKKISERIEKQIEKREKTEESKEISEAAEAIVGIAQDMEKEEIEKATAEKYAEENRVK